MKKQFESYLRGRIRDYPVYVNIGPGRDQDPVSQITCGYQVDNPGWIAIVFDTRRRPAVDGEWTLHIEGNELTVTRWGLRLAREDAEITIGERLRDYLRTAFDSGVFASLPVTDDCMLTVEEFNGVWGWGTHADDSEEAFLGRIDEGARGLSPAKSLTYWIGILHNVALGKYEDDEWGFLVSDLVFERLEEQSGPIIVPLLKFVATWADQPEFDGDRPSKEINDCPMQSPLIRILQLVPSIGEGSRQEIRLLQAILNKAVKVNATRKLWGIIPGSSAEAMSQLSARYPDPVMDDATNRLVNVDDYL